MRDEELAVVRAEHRAALAERIAADAVVTLVRTDVVRARRRRSGACGAMCAVAELEAATARVLVAFTRAAVTASVAASATAEEESTRLC